MKATLLIAALALVACKSAKKAAPPAPPTPAQRAPGGGFVGLDDVGKAYVEAITKGDADLAKALFPSHDQLTTSIPCPGHPAIDKPGYTQAVVLAMGKKRHYQVDWLSTDPEGGARTFARGSSFENCSITADLTFQIVGLHYRDRTAGGAQEDSQRAELVRIGASGWYLYSF